MYMFCCVIERVLEKNEIIPEGKLAEIRGWAAIWRVKQNTYRIMAGDVNKSPIDV